MSAQHIPGPWKYIEGTDVYAEINGGTVCEVYIGSLSAERRSATANLIAAAPELLEALEKCIYIIGASADEYETLWRSDDEVNAAYDAAFAAIAKAKGETK